MTTERTIEIHTFIIHKKGDPSTKYDLTDLHGIDLYDHMKTNLANFIDSKPDLAKFKNSAYYIRKSDSEYQKYWDFDDSRQIIYGFLETGSYGVEQDIFDTQKKETTGKVKNTDAVMMPFFFLICIPKKKPYQGFLILERIKNYGINSVFTEILKEYVGNIDKDYYFKTNRYIDKDVVRSFVKEGDYKEITLTKNSLPAVAAKRLGLREHETDEFKLQLKIIGKKKDSFRNTTSRRKIVELLDKDYRNFFTIDELNNLGFDNDTIIGVRSKLDGAEKVIDMSDTMKMRPYYKIYVYLDGKGFSDFESITEKTIHHMDKHLNHNLYDN